MIKKFFSLCLTVFMILELVSCGSQGQASEKSESSHTKKLVVASIYPVYDFTKKIAGDKAEVKVLIPIGMQSHSWEPSSDDIKTISKADMFIFSGAGMEPWAEDIISSANNEELKTVDTSENVELLKSPHHHDDEDEHDDEMHEHDHGEFDPHIWLSLKNAVIQLENIKNALSELDPENEDYYEQNFEKYKSEFLAMDSEFAKKAAYFSNHSIVVSHEAFGYLCRDYGLKQVGITGLFAGGEPDLAKMKEIIDFVKDNKINTIFYESHDTEKTAGTIADEVGIQTDSLNPAENLTKDEFKNNADYISIMKANFDSLEKALK